MEFDFDRLKEQGIDLANRAKETALDLANKGRMQAQLLDQQAKLSKAQRQLGALVYSLQKSGEENAPLVAKYVESIDEIENAIQSIRAELGGDAPADVEADSTVSINIDDDNEAEDAPAAEAAPAPAEEPAAPAGKVCPQCGAPVAEDELFCNHCGAQL